MTDKIEKRKSVRWIKRLTLKFSDPDGLDLTRRAVTENIGEGGLQLVVPYEFQLEQPVKVTIELMNDSIPIEATCKVTHISPERQRFRVGLRFAELERFQKVRLMRYLSKEEK